VKTADLPELKKLLIKLYMRILLCIMLGLTYFSPKLSAQNIFDVTLNKLAEEYPQEKIYIHFDKEAYNPGERIWFKAYLFSGLLPSTLSKTIYAELLDEKGQIIERITAPVFNGGAASSFDIPGDINQNRVYVRAYTAWMLNFDHGFLFTREIPVMNVSERNASSKVSDWMLEFFPEGGDLVQNLESRVAFKFRDSRGLPFDQSAVIMNNKEEIVAEIHSVHHGMGSFRMTPKPGEKYSAKWTNPRGEEVITQLPEAIENGVVLEIYQASDALHYRLARADESEGRNFYVVAQMQQMLFYRARANLLHSSAISGKIPLEDIPSGIIQFTVFNESHQPVAERIAFIQLEDYSFQTDITISKKSLKNRGKNLIQLEVSDTSITNLSVSVTDAELNPGHLFHENIYSSLLLTSDLKGYVHQPGYYFMEKGKEVNEQLDLVMLTNGWRRFKWEEVLTGIWPEIKYRPQGYINVKGQIDDMNGKVLSLQELNLLVATGGKQEFANIRLDSTGKVNIPDLLFFDSAKLYYQFNHDKNKVLTRAARFHFESEWVSDSVKYFRPYYYAWAAKDISAAEEKNKAIAQEILEKYEGKTFEELQTVTVKAMGKTKTDLLNDEYTSGIFKTSYAKIFNVEDDPQSRGKMTVLDYLQARVPGVEIVTDMYGSAVVSWRGQTPVIYLNEIATSIDVIQSIPLDNIALVKAFRPPFFALGANGGYGAIAVYTKKGGGDYEGFDAMDYITVSGYTPIRQFYSPDYENEDIDKDGKDSRITLYWNPFLSTDKDNRKISLSFHNNDFTRKIRVVAEGITEDGRLTRVEKIIQ